MKVQEGRGKGRQCFYSWYYYSNWWSRSAKVSTLLHCFGSCTWNSDLQLIGFLANDPPAKDPRVMPSHKAWGREDTWTGHMRVGMNKEQETKATIILASIKFVLSLSGFKSQHSGYSLHFVASLCTSKSTQSQGALPYFEAASCGRDAPLSTGRHATPCTNAVNQHVKH